MDGLGLLLTRLSLTLDRLRKLLRRFFSRLTVQESTEDQPYPYPYPHPYPYPKARGGEPTECACVVEREALREERGVEDHGRPEDEEGEVERRCAHVPPLEQIEGHADGQRGQEEEPALPPRAEVVAVVGELEWLVDGAGHLDARLEDLVADAREEARDHVGGDEADDHGHPKLAWWGAAAQCG